MNSDDECDFPRECLDAYYPAMYERLSALWLSTTSADRPTVPEPTAVSP